MPVAIVILDDKLPATIAEENDNDLLVMLNALDLPVELVDVEHAKSWLEQQPPPSGWFVTAEDARVFTLAVTREKDARFMKAVIDQTGLSTVKLSAALNMSDPNKDGSPIRKIMAAKQGISGPTRRLLAYILKHGVLDSDAEQAVFAAVGDGWKVVERRDLRRWKVAG